MRYRKESKATKQQHLEIILEITMFLSTAVAGKLHSVKSKAGMLSSSETH